MISRFLKPASILAGLLLLVGCDPEGMIKSKVPESIQQLLTFAPSARKGKGQAMAILELTAPKSNELFPVDKEVVFLADFRTDEPKTKENAQFTWMLFKENDPKGVKAGTGKSLKKRLEPGNYRVEVTAAYADQRLVKKTSFRVAFTAPGKVTLPEGTGLPGVEIALAKLDNHEEISRTQTDKSGSFLVESLTEGYFAIIPRMKGFSFSPFHKIAKLGRQPSALDFKAVKAEIANLRLTETAEQGESLESLCPGQDVFLKMDMKVENKPSRMEVFLVHRENEKEGMIQLDQVSDSTEKESSAAPLEGRPVLLKVPSVPHLGPLAPAYHLRVDFTDEKGNSYSSEASNTFKIDILGCFHKRFERGVALHEKGDLEQAAKMYSDAEQFGKSLQESSQLLAGMPKVYFDRGIAYLGSAFSKEPGDAKRLNLLGKAILDFNSVLRGQNRDADALLFRGAASQSAGNYEAAVNDYSAVLRIEPKATEVKKLRASAYVKTGRRENLSNAVDDFTEVITNDPSAQDLRKSRGAVLKLIAQPSGKSEDSRVETTNIPLPDMRQGLDLLKYIRK